MKSYETLAELQGLVGEVVGTSDWVSIDQQRINTFAEATGDHQWIHVDPERAATGPFGKPIAHGFLTLSLLPTFMTNAFELRDVNGRELRHEQSALCAAGAGGQPVACAFQGAVLGGAGR